MTERVQSVHPPVVSKEPEELDAVQWTLRRRGDTFSLAMAFDPGDGARDALAVRGIDVMLGLLWLRGWRRAGQAFRFEPAPEWTGPEWDRPLGPRAFIVESDLVAAGATDTDDVPRAVALATVAWSMAREMDLAGRPIPGLTAAFAPDGVVLASIGGAPLRDAIRAHGASVLERMAALAESAQTAAHAYVALHLEGSTVRPWSLPDRSCAFASADPGADRVFVALQDTAGDPQPETARTLLRLMLASGAGN